MNSKLTLAVHFVICILTVVTFRQSLTVQRNTSPPSSGSNSKPNKKPGDAGDSRADHFGLSVSFTAHALSPLLDWVNRKILTYFAFISLREG